MSMYYVIEWIGFGWVAREGSTSEDLAVCASKKYRIARVVNDTLIPHLADMKPPFESTRLYFNKEILKKLSLIVETNPDLRFMQILAGCNIGEESFYQESSETLTLIDDTLKSGWFDAT